MNRCGPPNKAISLADKLNMDHPPPDGSGWSEWEGDPPESHLIGTAWYIWSICPYRGPTAHRWGASRPGVQIKLFETIDEARQWCEEQEAKEAGNEG